MSKEKTLFFDQLSEPEQMLWHAIESRIRVERYVYKNPLKNIYLLPELFQVYEDIRKRCMDAVGADVGYLFDGVHIHKGSIVQKDALRVDGSWAQTKEQREKQRALLKMQQLN